MSVRRIPVMLITRYLDENLVGGRESLYRLNRDSLRSIYSDKLAIYEIKPRAIVGYKALIDAFKGHIEGADREVVDDILKKIRLAQVKKVFIDGSNLGYVVNIIKLRMPEIETITFFHNVEVRFFLGSLRYQKSVRAVGILAASYLAERKAVKSSDKRICLSERDSKLLKKTYGSSATHISPIAVRDQALATAKSASEKFIRNRALFVGGSFYANRAGITWFIKKVLPFVDLEVHIVGRGFEHINEELNYYDRVKVVGEVGDLSQWYFSAHFIIAPIFDGSGMKTKVAEAMMFGKRIIGTPEAFSGYHEEVRRLGWVCESDVQFIDAITQAKCEIGQAFDRRSRKLYEKYYSFQAARDRLASALAT